MKICSHCVLNERFPGIKFNRDGICNYCSSAKKKKQPRMGWNKYQEKFMQLISQYKAKGCYDCLVAYSGGKDSTYTLHLLKDKYDLNLLTFSFDNGFQSDGARRNIRNALNNFKVDHWTITPNFEVMKKIFLDAVDTGVHMNKALTRASSICSICITLIRFVGFRLAVDLEIPLVAFGMSPGQASLATGLVKTNARLIRTMQESVFLPLWNRLGDCAKSFFLEERHFRKTEKFPYSVNPLVFTEYKEEKILKIARQYGWEKPDDTDANSTNCLLNSFANQVHIERFGFNPYAYEIAELVRLGCMTREEGLRRLNTDLPQEQIDSAKRKLGLETS
ncbi:MAG: hypothetical protein AMJ79_00240 [Phycisphaerae bacterium SM23_30]|nr:MAG: hypothetical protein AMJ79_00240 [Phycisphaerae bacterium SM23_30]